jgi:prophage regulatory protein
MSQSIQRLDKVKQRTGLSRSSIYLKMQDGTFPPSVKISTRAIGWSEEVITEWIEQRIAESQGGEV